VSLGCNANNAAPANIDRTVFIVAIPALITVPNLPFASLY
jgi:hypothetical protein